MQQGPELLKKSLEHLKTQQQIPNGGVSKPSECPELLANVNKIYTTLRITYPAWYCKHYGTETSEKMAKRIWAIGLKYINTAQVNQGLQRMLVEHSYPPNLCEFIRLCRRMDDLPSLERAWGQALIGDYQHEAVKIAAKLTGSFELIRSCYNNQPLRRRFEYYFEQVVNSLMDGVTMAKLTQALENSTSKQMEQIEQQALQQLEKRIAKQGISKANARAQCLAMLGLKD